MTKGNAEMKGSRLRRWWWLGIAILFGVIKITFTTIGIVVIAELVVNGALLDYEVRKYAALFFVACSYGFIWLVGMASDVLVKERNE